MRAFLIATLALGAPLRAQVPERLTAAEFAALSARLSEPAGFFDTDNLVSNEDSYLHAVSGFARHGVHSGAYIGVGPDQNFSYIAALRPGIAFILDIRRDNLLEHLLFKSLFARSASRIEYLCLLFGQPLPGDAAGWGERDLVTLLDYLARTAPDARAAERARRLVRAELRESGFPLSAQDLATIARFHATFMSQGPALRLVSYGRPVREDYPDYRQLLLETDLDGRRSNYLAREADFQFVQSLQARNLIVPVVGDFAGPHALAAIGQYLAQRGARVSAFYTSNVEQYLFQGRSFERFTRNVARLPRDSTGVIVSSYFPYQRGHPHRRPGYLSVQLLQRIGAFLAAGEYRGYLDLVTRDVLPP